eukprot:TRINITY_DN21857_c0_g1_i2.p1 TRINITY_DN21857_c0_g1~~TRINITY_DN21857_c0_g1_i2.p1  ORF type:complete len:126 (-),score=17.09 TRINITY_DN21857_c0_g1_i2:34-411(-)
MVETTNPNIVSLRMSPMINLYCNPSGSQEDRILINTTVIENVVLNAGHFTSWQRTFSMFFDYWNQPILLPLLLDRAKTNQTIQFDLVVNFRVGNLKIDEIPVNTTFTPTLVTSFNHSISEKEFIS